MLLSPINREDYFHRNLIPGSCQEIAMETDSSDEREIYNNKFSSSSSSEDHDQSGDSVTYVPAGTGFESLTECYRFPFHDVPTPEFKMEIPDFEDDSCLGMQRLFVENTQKNKPNITPVQTIEPTSKLFDDDDDNDDDDDDEGEEEEDESDGFDLFGERDDDEVRSNPIRSVASHVTYTETGTNAKTKVDNNLTEVGEGGSVLDNILKKYSSEMVDKKQQGVGTQGETGEEDFCCICRDDYTDPIVLPKCSHEFCRECIDQYFKIKPVCPECFVPYGIITGNQPEGHMDYSVNKKVKLQGFDAPGAIVIYYGFSDGTQTDKHPKPGKPYYGTSRTAYLPDTPEGHKVAKLLDEAFKRRLVFTVGRSRTTGADDVVTWNDIHHKTSPCGGQENFGYPDPTYLERVQQELAAVGVTEESLAANQTSGK